MTTEDPHVNELEAELQAVKQNAMAFTYAVSHDLEQRLRAVSGFSQLLEQHYLGTVDARFDRYIERILSNALELHSMVDGLLLISRVATRGRDMEPTFLDGPLEVALERLKRRITASGARIRRAEALPSASVDPHQFSMVFEELIANALKFSGERAPDIEIAGGEEEAQIRLSITDRGVGVHPDRLTEVFGVFVQIERVATEGVGVGLTVVQRVVERHRGRIWIDPEYQDGCRVWVTLPR